MASEKNDLAEMEVHSDQLHSASRWHMSVSNILSWCNLTHRHVIAEHQDPTAISKGNESSFITSSNLFLFFASRSDASRFLITFLVTDRASASLRASRRRLTTCKSIKQSISTENRKRMRDSVLTKRSLNTSDSLLKYPESRILSG